MSILAKKCFRDEAAAFAHLEGVLWPEGPICPHCGTIGKAGRLQGVRTKPSAKHPEGVVRHGLWKCYSKECRKQFTVRIGTVFEAAHIPLHKVLQAAYLLCSSKKGFSAHQLSRALEPIREVWIHDEVFTASRLSMMRIMARRTKAATVIA